MSGRISEAELAVMEVLWRESPLAALDVAERIDPARGWSNRTAKTMLGRLLAKGVLAHEDGRRYRHLPVAAAFWARVAHALWKLPALRMMLLVLREWTSPLLPGSSPVDPVVAATFAAPVVAGRANVAPAAMLDLVPLLALAWLAESVIWFGGQMLRHRRIAVRCVKKRRWRRARWSSPNSASDRENIDTMGIDAKIAKVMGEAGMTMAMIQPTIDRTLAGARASIAATTDLSADQRAKAFANIDEA